MLSHNNNKQQLPNPDENRSIPNKNRNQYNAGINNRTRMLTTLSPSATHPNRAHRFQQMLHSIPDTTNTYGGNSHLTNHPYQGTQNRRHSYCTVPFGSSHTYYNQWGFTIEGHPGQVIGFTAGINKSTSVISFIPSILLLATWKHHHMQEAQLIKAINCHPSW